MIGIVWIKNLLFYMSKVKKFLNFKVTVTDLDFNIPMSIDIYIYIYIYIYTNMNKYVCVQQKGFPLSICPILLPQNGTLSH